MMEINKAVDFVERALPDHKSMALRSAWQTLRSAVLAQQTNNSAMPKLDENIVEWFRGYIADFEPDLYALAGRLRTILEFIESVQLRHSA